MSDANYLELLAKLSSANDLQFSPLEKEELASLIRWSFECKRNEKNLKSEIDKLRDQLGMANATAHVRSVHIGELKKRLENRVNIPKGYICIPAAVWQEQIDTEADLAELVAKLKKDNHDGYENYKSNATGAKSFRLIQLGSSDEYVLSWFINNGTIITRTDIKVSKEGLLATIEGIQKFTKSSEKETKWEAWEG